MDICKEITQGRIDLLAMVEENWEKQEESGDFHKDLEDNFIKTYENFKQEEAK